MTETNGNAVEFTPRFEFDLEHGTAAKFTALVEQYDAWHGEEPPTEPLDLTDGWHTITPAQAEQLLRRNRPGANRKSAFGTIQYYAHQMMNDSWPKTGQPIILTEDGVLIDGAHRLWACLLSGVPFQTYVVVSVPVFPRLFAYVDNNRPRPPAAALATAGYDGQSPTMAAVLKIVTEFHTYTPSQPGRVARVSPIGYIELAEANPNAVRACRLVAADWEPVVALTGYKDVVGYVGMRIIDLHGEEVADEFFGQLVDYENQYPDDGAIMKLRKLVREDQRKPKPMKRHQVLGNVIKAFNSWVTGEELPRRWVMAVNDDFPRFAEPAESPSTAAEGETLERTAEPA